MKLIDTMLSATTKIWKKYFDHPFVKGIEDGTLDVQKFRYYIIQDYLYLADYAKVFGIGIAKSKTVDGMRFFAHYAYRLLEAEMDIHRGYMDRLQLTQTEIDSTPVKRDNLAYTSYMLRIAYEEGEAEVLACVLACAYSYEVIAKNITKNNPQAINHPFFGDWIAGYASESYSANNIKLINTLHQVTKDYTDIQKQHLVQIFVTCSKHELAFWDLSWKAYK